ncbi:Arm DNA-binding domain-containing protein [Laribacter hongkongensis]|uniref:Arm DNA-binding domain-containing protein n=1 Tax=Laribacter hongkongensis TaxID=168471 RepID=UPI001EFCCF54|nr:Arm DNA-binding domain-containing protein [Laribacter hongkongensis]MCG9094822.1 integrase arm-type DNA-binding domain-containing protein [Laribacter hongkongensis]
MARTTVPLTDAACRLVKTNGIKSWRMKYIKPNGKQGLTSFGNYPAVSLAIARELRAKAIDLLATGTDPVVHKQQASRLLPTPSKPSRANGTTRCAASGAMTMPGASSSDWNRTGSQPSESI